MPGLGELLIIGVVALLFGGGSSAALIAGLRRKAMEHATGAVRAEADKVVPAEFKQAADVMRKVQRGDVGGLLGAPRRHDDEDDDS